jgi:hypothetical protein
LLANLRVYQEFGASVPPSSIRFKSLAVCRNR